MSEAHEARVCELLEKGLQHYGMGEPARALAIWSEVLSLDPGNIRAAEYIKFVSEGLEGGEATPAVEVAAPIGPAAALAVPDPGAEAQPAATPPVVEPALATPATGEGEPAAEVVEVPAAGPSEPAAADPDLQFGSAVAPTPDLAFRPALDPDDPLAVSWGDLVEPAAAPVDTPADRAPDAAVELASEPVAAAADAHDPGGAAAEALAPPGGDHDVAIAPPRDEVSTPEASAAAAEPAPVEPAVAEPGPASGPVEPGPVHQPSPEAIVAGGAATPGDLADEDDIARIVEVAPAEPGLASPPLDPAPASDEVSLHDASGPAPTATVAEVPVPAVPAVDVSALAAPATSAVGHLDRAADAAPAAAVAVPAPPASATDWSQAIEDLSEREISPVAALLTSAHAAPPAPDEALVRPSLTASATEVVSLPGGAATRLHLVEPEAPTEPAAAADPWDDGPALSAPVRVQPIEQEFLSPTSGEHAVEVVSQPSGPGAVSETPRGAAGEPEAPAEFDRLMQGARDMFELGDFSGSLELVEKVLELDPDNAQARDYLERNQGTLLKMYESKIGSFTQVPRVTIPPDEIIWLNLHHRAGFLLAQIDGLVTFEDLLSLSAMSKLETCKILVQLISEGVIVAS